ncbi:LOW QUALITY PROTEIN: ABC transporter A family member 1 [Rhodamnia argentea]|uniref:LOW QUALITY PROTEIN: ABC transporter A family member 1 n=1 Tax=Rhodamnia argentea TaxID=178133 RepID=A0ABM3HZL4_9MYRT|nr:LOW QUALITY PROTEIN: ABC transporter A family member 1 [Rhodamnia argentea]
MGDSWRQLKVMLRKNWLLKIRNPFVTAAEILLPTIVILLLVAVRTRVDTQIHPAQSHIRKGMLVEIGKGISPNFQQVLELLYSDREFLAFAPDTEETRRMIDWMSIKFPLLKLVHKIYKDEEELETYIRSDIYGTCSEIENCSNPKIKGAVAFHGQGPHIYDYSIRLNHTWAFSGFPNPKTIMDTNGPFLNDLHLGVNIIPTMQYSSSGFFTLQQVLDSFILLSAQQTQADMLNMTIEPLSKSSERSSSLDLSWKQFIPSDIRIVPFPTREYTDDEFQSIIKTVMGVLYLLGFLYPISRLISYSVFEKEEKIKEGLYMMGLKDGIFHLSWFITYSLQFAISSGIITVCTMDNLFKYSDKSVVFVYFFSFGLSAIMMSFMISAFFTRAKTAVAVGTLSFLGAFFPYYTVNDEGVPMILKVIASLLSPTAFALGSVNFADYERAHVGLRWSNIWLASSGVNFLVCVVMMLFDSILCCLIGFYLNKVLTGERGVLYPLDFILDKGFRRKKNSPKHQVVSVEVHDKSKVLKKRAAFPGIDSEPAIESISMEMKQQELDQRCIQIRNLHKVYATKKGTCCAVNSLQLTLYENQILALLGHNGAGKSTTISMLVGLLSPTSGDALVLGRNITTEMDEIRKCLGVCPQNDILFPELTVREHLEIYAVLKGVGEDLLERVVTDMVDEVGLADKINTCVRALSGGMKRKLSLGIALIGNSKVIILDEPTSGMDPYSMRLTWQLIKKIKKGRIVLLTTHSMDEADELGDRIAIMANGSLKCWGSSLFLKHQFGVGYTLTLVKSAPTASVAADIVYRHIPSAICISEVGTEISFKLPLASSPFFESMFREIEGCMKRSMSSSRKLGVDENLGIESYGISVTTLEEVFLRVAGCDYDVAETAAEENISVSTNNNSSQDSCGSTAKMTFHNKVCGCYKKALWILPALIGKACSFFVAGILSLLSCFSMQCCSCSIISRSIFWQHCKALFIKRAISARRDRKTIVFQLLIPAVFLFLGLLLLKLKPHPDQQSITYTTSHFNPLLSGGGGGGPIPFDLSWPIANEVAQHVEGGLIQRFKPTTYKFPDSQQALVDAVEVAGPNLGPALLSMSEYLMSSFNESYQSRYGAVVMDDQNDDGSLGYTVLHNCSCQHSAPTFINLMNSAILRLATQDENMTIRTRNHPLPMTVSQRVQRHDLDAFSAAIIINIAFSFIPASFAVSIVKEREVKAKHQQLISGVSILSYWTSIYTWDFVSFLFPSSFAIALFYIFGLDQFIGAGSFLPTVLMFLEYGLAIASSTYCLTFFFTDHTMAQNVVLLVHVFTGLILMVISFIMGLIQTTRSTNDFLKNFFRVSPGFCFADGLASLALLRQGMKDNSSRGTYYDWNVTGASLFYLGVESIVYFALTLGLEQFPSHKLTLAAVKESWQKIMKNHSDNSASYSEPLLKSSSKSGSLDYDEDSDVLMERKRVLSGSIDNAIIYLRDLRKVYSGSNHHGIKVAVHSLTFSVQEGECFGFLGTNGAGKTTTLSMLTGEEYPTGGTAFVFGKDIRSNPKAARRHIGYCPQFDALLDYLTVQEHLELYARIKRVADQKINDVVMEKLVEFDLLKYAKRPSFTLSGGNKRKLSVAIAMIGDPPIVILDEPSTGMDPIAKRFMWDVISRLSTRRGKTAVILTTHSMNEAQALCTRIGIMVGGRLRCIGSPQHLKTRFGNHLELEVKPTEVDPNDLVNLCQIIRGKLFDIPQPRRLLDGLEVCIGAMDSITAENATVAEISLSKEMIMTVGHWLGNEERTRTLLMEVHLSDGVVGEQLSDQLFRDGGIPLPIFCEWWLTKEKFSVIDSFVVSSFPGAKFQNCNGLCVKYQLPYGEGSSLANAFGHLERNRNRLGISEYSISQSTLESIFNRFAANA